MLAGSNRRLPPSSTLAHPQLTRFAATARRPTSGRPRARRPAAPASPRSVASARPAAMTSTPAPALARAARPPAPSPAPTAARPSLPGTRPSTRCSTARRRAASTSRTASGPVGVWFSPPTSPTWRSSWLRARPRQWTSVVSSLAARMSSTRTPGCPRRRTSSRARRSSAICTWA